MNHEALDIGFYSYCLLIRCTRTAHPEDSPYPESPAEIGAVALNGLHAHQALEGKRPYRYDRPGDSSRQFHRGNADERNYRRKPGHPKLEAAPSPGRLGGMKMPLPGSRAVLVAAVLLLPVALAILGCAAPGPTAAPTAHTLTGNPLLPAGDMAKFFTPDKWTRLREIEYAGYVIIEAQIRPDGSVVLGREIESYPDASWNVMARTLGQQVRLHANTVGSHLDGKAQIYVVFFPRGWDGNMALIFGQQVGGAIPGTAQRATCLTTTRY